MKAIIHNDDIGLSYGFTEAIKDSFLKGITTSTSIRTNGIAYNWAVRLLKSQLKTIGLGLHLNLDDGLAHLPYLANSKGVYKLKFPGYLFALKRGDKTLVWGIQKELAYQFKKATDDGLYPDHVSGHNHIYMIPPIFEIICKLSKKYGIKRVRLPREPYHLTGSLTNDLTPYLNSNIFKFLILNKFAQENYKTLKEFDLETADAFYGLLHTNNMNQTSVMAAIRDAKRKQFKIIEVLGHSAYQNDKRDKIFTSREIESYIKSKRREIETRTFRSSALKEFLKRENVKPATYRDI